MKAEIKTHEEEVGIDVTTVRQAPEEERVESRRPVEHCARSVNSSCTR